MRDDGIRDREDPSASETPRGGAQQADLDATGEERDAAAADDEGRAAAGDAEASTSTVKSDEAQRTMDELRDRYLRLAAEFENYRRRTTRERQEAGARAQAELIRQIVDPLDDLARVASVDPNATDVASVIRGVDLVEQKLMKALTAAGLEVVNPIDQAFDPARQEAVATEPALSREDDHLVARVYQPGYVFNGQLLRPARVVVKQWNG